MVRNIALLSSAKQHCAPAYGLPTEGARCLTITRQHCPLAYGLPTGGARCLTISRQHCAPSLRGTLAALKAARWGTMPPPLRGFAPLGTPLPLVLRAPVCPRSLSRWSRLSREALQYLFLWLPASSLAACARRCGLFGLGPPPQPSATRGAPAPPRCPRSLRSRPARGGGARESGIVPLRGAFLSATALFLNFHSGVFKIKGSCGARYHCALIALIILHLPPNENSKRKQIPNKTNHKQRKEKM